LMFIAKQKDLSFGEKSLLSTTEDLIVQEIMVIRSDERDEAVREIRAPFREYVSIEGGQKQTPTSVL